jgi:DNA-binding transcriptional ArsR family regulator
VSGYDESNDLIPRLNGRLLTIKDLTTILSKNKESSSQIFADFREMTDGYIKKEFGNGVTKEYHGITSSILFASTNAIEHFNSIYSSLGQRIIFQRPKNNRTEAMKRAQANTGKESQMRSEISEVVRTFLEDKVSMVQFCDLPPMGDNEILYNSYEFLALARTTIEKDFRGEIEEIPEPEFPTRIAKTVSQLCQVHALIHDRYEVTPDDIAFGARIIKDNVPTQRWLVLSNMQKDWKPTGSIADAIKLPSSTALRALDDLTALGLVERQHRDSDDYGTYRRSNLYRITEEAYDTVHNLENMAL